MPHVILGTMLAGVPALIGELGGDSSVLLRDHGLDPGAADDHDRFVDYACVAGVIANAAHRLQCPDFGLRLAQRQNTDVLGPFTVIVRNERTVGAAIDKVSLLLHNIAPADSVSLVRDGDHAIVTFDTDLRRSSDRHHMIERGLGTVLAALRQMVGDDFLPTRVTFQHHRISPNLLYQNAFGVVPVFGSEYNSVRFPASTLLRPIRGRDDIALGLVDELFSSARPDPTSPEDVRSAVRRLLPIGDATLAGVADTLSLHPRVMQRRLTDAGTSFEKILDEIRRDTAVDLSGANLPISTIAAMLGYAEQSSYARACRRWFGITPRQLRDYDHGR